MNVRLTDFGRKFMRLLREVEKLQAELNEDSQQTATQHIETRGAGCKKPGFIAEAGLRHVRIGNYRLVS